MAPVHHRPKNNPDGEKQLQRPKQRDFMVQPSKAALRDALVSAGVQMPHNNWDQSAMRAYAKLQVCYFAWCRGETK